MKEEQRLGKPNLLDGSSSLIAGCALSARGSTIIVGNVGVVGLFSHRSGGLLNARKAKNGELVWLVTVDR